jgi:hypothetical protein
VDGRSVGVDGIVGSEHLGDEVAAFAAEAAVEIFVEAVEMLLGVFFGEFCFAPEGLGAGIDAFGAALGVFGGIVDGDGDGFPVFFAVVEDEIFVLARFADGEGGDFADFVAVDVEKTVIWSAGDGFGEERVVEDAVGGDGWWGSGHGRKGLYVWEGDWEEGCGGSGDLIVWNFAPRSLHFANRDAEAASRFAAVGMTNLLFWTITKPERLKVFR